MRTESVEFSFSSSLLFNTRKRVEINKTVRPRLASFPFFLFFSKHNFYRKMVDCLQFLQVNKNLKATFFFLCFRNLFKQSCHPSLGQNAPQVNQQRQQEESARADISNYIPLVFLKNKITATAPSETLTNTLHRYLDTKTSSSIWIQNLDTVYLCIVYS